MYAVSFLEGPLPPPSWPHRPQLSLMGVATGVAPIPTAIGSTATFADPATMTGAEKVGAGTMAGGVAGAVVIVIVIVTTTATAAIDTDAAPTPNAIAEKGMSADPATSDPIQKPMQRDSYTS
jgi:hypothetical protein